MERQSTPPLLRLLLIEDSQDDADLILRELAPTYEVVAERVETLSALTAALVNQRWDLVVAEFMMRAFHGVTALSLVRAYDADVPFIFVSGTAGEDVAVAAMKTGAHDYLMKNNLRRLVSAVECELREASLRRERKVADARLAYLAYHDALTQLPNRVLLDDRLQQGILAAARADEPLSLLMLDLDGFKAINDSLGHAAGDRVLQEVAGRLRSMLREVDTVARLGGDEFAIVLPRTDRDGAGRTAEKILYGLERPLMLDGRVLNLAGSIGIVSFPEHGADGADLIQRADAAMYAAKRAHTGWAVYAPDDAAGYGVEAGNGVLPSTAKVRSLGEKGVA
jgi:diguanylate cyclase (GGDEF)-like protein